MVLHLFCKHGHFIASLTQLPFTRYPNGVISKKSFHAPRSIGDAEGLLGRREGGRLVMSEPTCVAADTRDGCHQVPRVENRVAGHRLNWGKRGRAPTTQMSLCQRQHGIPEGVFQW